MADGAAPRRRQRLRRGGIALLALGAAQPAAAQSLLFPEGLFGGPSRPESPFPAPLAPGQVAPPVFWQPDLLPELGAIGPAPPGAPPQPFRVTPSLGLQGVATDNVRNSATNRESDAWLSVSPGITAAADTVNLVGAITYQPRARFHYQNTDQNRVDHLLRGSGTATLIEDRLFLQASAFGNVTSAFGDFLGDDLQPDAADNLVQTITYQVSPYYIQRFGDFADARIGYVFRQVFQDGDAAFEPGQTRPFFTATDFSTHQFYGTLDSGAAFGRFGWTVSGSATEFTGDGVFDGAYNRVAGVQLRYAVTRELAALVGGGWQRARYNSAVPFEVDDAIWNVGFRYQPDETSFLTVGYGQFDGRTSFSVRGGLNVGPRTRLFVRFDERLTGSGLSAGEGLSNLRVDAFGNLVESATGAPAALAFGSPLQNVQSGIFRTRRGSIGLSRAFLRDSVSIGYTRVESDPVAIQPGTNPFSQDTDSFSIGWTRSLEPGMSVSASARYGIIQSEGRDDRNSYALTASLFRALTPTLLGNLSYEFSSREVSGAAGRADRNTVVVGLRQLF